MFALTNTLTNHVHSMSLNDVYCTTGIYDRSSKMQFLGQNRRLGAKCRRIQWPASISE
jgi:hypothetical protein